MFVSKTLTEVAALKANQIAIIYNDNTFSYDETNTISNTLAISLAKKGIKQGDVIAALLPNCPEFAFTYFAAMKLGAVFMPIDQKLSEAEVSSLIQDSNTRICFTYAEHPLSNRIADLTESLDISAQEFQSAVNNPFKDNDLIPDIKPDDTALYLHTSGTTNRPKIVELTNANLDCFPKAMKNCTILGEKEVLGIILPMSHISGPIILNLLITNKCKLVIIDSINPVSLFENISKHKITYFHAVPPVFSLMLKAGFADKYNTSSLDIIAMMGTSVPVSLMNAFKKAFPHVVVLQGYGLTETSPLITLTKREDADRKRASMGTPVEDAEVKVVDENNNVLKENEIGELIVNGPMVMKGYLALPEENKDRLHNGYFYTNDMVKYDRDYYFYHMGRRDDMVVLANGMKVYPSEVQNVLHSIPTILEAVVFGMQSKKDRGNILQACVVPVPGMKIDASEIREFCIKNLASFKVPKKVTVMVSFPKTSTGKINVRAIKEQLIKNDK